MSFTSFMMRLMCTKTDRKRDKGLKPPAALRIEKNIPYGPHRKNLLDLYIPEAAKAPVPVIVSVHGGGWVYGDKEVYRHYCMDLARRGFAVLNFTYRLSPEHKFPCHVEDTALSFRWLKSNAAAYGLDAGNIFAVGDSAGGHILSLYCALCTNPSFAAGYPFSLEGCPTPKAVALNCGVYDLTDAWGLVSGAEAVMKDVLGHIGTAEELRAMSPLYHINEGFPPCIVMTCNDDFLREQAPPLMKVLDEKKLSYEYCFYGDDSVKLGHVFHLDIRNPQGIACNDEQCAYFERHIG